MKINRNLVVQGVIKKYIVLQTKSVKEVSVLKKRMIKPKVNLRPIILIAFLIISIVCVGCQSSSVNQNEISQNQDNSFPHMLDQQLEIVSLSTASMPNPDANGEMGENIASLEIRNKTGEFISFAEIEVTLTDETHFCFIIYDLPIDGLVQAFDVNNTVYDDNIACKSIEVKEVQLEDEQLMQDKIAFSVDETKVTLTNISQSDLENVIVTCLCDMGDSYFGGTSYSYHVEKINSGGSVLLDATDCYLGVAEVVKIAVEK